MPTIQEIRQQYPQYQDISDRELGDKLYAKFYSDMPREEFDTKVGLKKQDYVSPKETFGMELSSAIPFGGKITSALAAGAVAPFVPETFGELYEQGQEYQQAGREQNPKAALAGSLVGTAATIPAGFTSKVAQTGLRGATNVIPKAIQKTGQFVGSGGLGARIAKGAAVGAGTGALYGAGEDNAAMGAGLGAVTGAAIPAVGAAISSALKGSKNIVKGIGARSVEALDDATNAIKAQSSAAYQRMRDTGAMLNPNASQNVLTNVMKKIDADGISIPENVPKTTNVLKRFSDRISNSQNNPLGIEELDQWRQAFGDAATTLEKQDARKARIAIEAIDDAIDDIGANDLVGNTAEAIDALKLGRSEWKRARQFETITDIVKRADGDPNVIKRELSKLVMNPKKTRGMSPTLVKEIKEASKLSTGEGLLKIAGRFGFDIGSARAGGVGVSPLIGGALGYGVGGGGVGAAVPVVGTLARQGQKWLARGKVEKILNLIEQGIQPTIKQMNDLPVSDAKKLINIMRISGTGQVSNIGE